MQLQLALYKYMLTLYIYVHNAECRPVTLQSQICIVFYLQYEMSSTSRVPAFDDCNEPSQIESQSHDNATDVGRAVTDAVHERFRRDMVYCDNCKEKFSGDFGSIHKHFNKSHPAVVKCIYCPGKVFCYYKVQNNDNKGEQFYYHRCRDWLEK